MNLSESLKNLKDLERISWKVESPTEGFLDENIIFSSPSPPINLEADMTWFLTALNFLGLRIHSGI